ncbi:MAG: type II secretion system protein GspH [Crocinitomicaceae bacterium]|jgi:general secretion pathway protein G|nr:MAG: type II secretion system protein GspH [Crocinitomicaceae bacterium]
MFYRSIVGQRQQGFTLIEVMLVIVIMAVMTSLVVMNIQGIDQRKVMQARELLLLDLQRIRLEAADQGRVLGLVFLPATDVAPSTYQVMEYVEKPAAAQQSGSHINTQVLPREYIWQVAKDFVMKPLPEQSALQIQMLEQQYKLDNLKLAQGQMPQLIWLGNGEVLPARLQLFWQQQPMGDAIELNRLGLVVKPIGAS